MSNRREFIKKSTISAAGITIGATGFSAKSYANILGSNDRITMAAIGLGQNRGLHLYKGFASMKEQGIEMKTVCDPDTKRLDYCLESYREMEIKNLREPGRVQDMREIFDDPEIDAVTVGTPNHWHALATVWACQAGKHVYVEKPCSHNIWEGRKMLEAARKYNRMVQVGFQNRSDINVMQAMAFLHKGGIGDVYMAKGLCYKPRFSFGIAEDSTPPDNLDYDLWLGPAKYQPYNEKKLHYNWHWHWNTGNGDTGNQGPHQFDIARWGLNKKEHPVSVYSTGGIYGVSPRECSQETPNTQTTLLKYKDGTMLEFETRGYYTNGESNIGIRIGNIFLGTEGWMEMDGGNWKAYRKKEKEPFAGYGIKAAEEDETFMTAPESKGHFGNFADAMRSGDYRDLNCDIREGHYSTVLPHLGNASYRTERSLRFNGEFEQFVNDPEADMYLTRRYRKPFIIPEQV
jgi:predicted dehydrogenase